MCYTSEYESISVGKKKIFPPKNLWHSVYFYRLDALIMQYVFLCP